MDTKKRWFAALAALLLVGALAAPAVAQSDTDTTKSPASADVEPAADVESADDLDGLDTDDVSDAEDMDAVNAETDALVAFLAERGFTVAVETDDDGFRYPAFTEADEANDELWAAVDEFFIERYGDDFDDLDGEFIDELTDEEIAEINAEEAELAAFLDSKGISYEIVEEGGIRWVEWDEDDEAANAAISEFFAPSADEVAEIQAEIDEWIAALDAAGIRYELVTDEYGISYPEVAEADLDKLEELEGEFFEDCEDLEEGDGLEHDDSTDESDDEEPAEEDATSDV